MDKQNCVVICQWLEERGRKRGGELVLMGCIINMEMAVAYAFVIGKISPLPLNLVNKSVSRERLCNRLSYLCLSFSGSGHQLDCFPRHGLRPARIKQSALLTIPIQNFGKG